MIAENNFINKLDAFLEQDLTDFEKDKIRILLREYRDEIPAIVVNKRVNVFVPTPPPDKICTKDILMREAKSICKKYEITLNKFLHPKKGKCTSKVTDIRKEFVNKMLQEYKTERKQLFELFNVDHSTITYYIKGKRIKYVRKYPLKKTA
jgi:hypothetical protein